MLTTNNGLVCFNPETESKHVYTTVLKPGEIEKVRKTILINGALNAKIVGQSAYTIAKLAGVEVPVDTKILIGEVESVDISEEFAHEKLSPVLAMYKAKTFDEALDKAERLVADGGYGVDDLASEQERVCDSYCQEWSEYHSAGVLHLFDEILLDTNAERAFPFGCYLLAYCAAERRFIRQTLPCGFVQELPLNVGGSA